ncbi:hypothetical protein J7E70_05875 [Variovorax paradoxus]|nr:hypothetical protein [Variovorax paradoxus]
METGMIIASPFPIPYGNFQPVLDWQAAFIEGLMQAQNFQLQMLAAWQWPFASVNQELWDQWAARFGGGVPLDA